MRHTDINAFRPVSDGAVGLRELNERSREVFKRIVETYLATGEPVGSRNLSRALPMTLSPASVRNVMSDLEALASSMPRIRARAGFQPNQACASSSTGCWRSAR